MRCTLSSAAVLVSLLVSACSGQDTPASAGSGGAPSIGATGGTPAVGSGGALASGGSLASGGALAAGAGGSSGGSAAGATSGGAASGGTSAGSGGAGAADGGVAGADAGTGTDGGATAVRPPCLQDPNQIVMIGDSYVNWITHTFPTDMNAASGLSIADYAIGGTSMGSGGIGLIPPQFDTALQTHPNILAVIMDGGGNDILVPDTVQFPNGGQCKNDGAQSPSIPDCQAIVQKALDAGAKLFAHMADSGVKDAIYFFYPHVPTNTWLATDPNGMLDYALPKIQAACDGAYEASLQVNPAKPIRCHFVNMVPVFQGHPEYFANADLHPNSTGSKAMAAAIWARMKKDCVAQPASSGCCSPD